MTEPNIPDECPDFEVEVDESTPHPNAFKGPEKPKIPTHSKKMMQDLVGRVCDEGDQAESVVHVDEDGVEHTIGVCAITPQDMSLCFRAVSSVLYDITNDRITFPDTESRDDVLQLYMRLSDKLKPMFDPRHLPGFDRTGDE